MQISPEKVVDEALTLMQQEGFDKVSLRNVAKRIGVRAPSLYWHFKNKQELLELMANSFVSRAIHAIPAGRTWEEALKAFGIALHNLLLQHKDSAYLCMKTASNSDTLKKGLDLISAPFIEYGLTRASALSYCASIISLCTGWVIYEQQYQNREDFLAEVDFSASFENGLDAIIIGFSEQHRSV